MKQQTDLIVRAINANTKPLKIVLFGSQARKQSHEKSDLDIAVIQNNPPQIGQKAKIFLTLTKLGYDWKTEPDIHLFSQKDFLQRLKQKDLFASQISKGETIYAR